MKGEFVFDSSDPVYKVHFPGMGIVPGSFIVGAFLQLLKGSVSEYRIKKFQFLEFLTPGTYQYSVKKHRGKILCELYRGERLMARGVLTESQNGF